MTSCYSHDVRSASCSADTVAVNQPQAETKLSLLWVLQYTRSFPSTPWGFDAFKAVSAHGSYEILLHQTFRGLPASKAVRSLEKMSPRVLLNTLSPTLPEVCLQASLFVFPPILQNIASNAPRELPASKALRSPGRRLRV